MSLQTIVTFCWYTSLTQLGKGILTNQTKFGLETTNQIAFVKPVWGLILGKGTKNKKGN